MTENIGVYKAIVNVQSALAKNGIAKDKTCTQGATYKFRGIDDIYNALAPYLAMAELCILPRMLERSCIERTSAKGNALFYTTVEAEFDFVSAKDGSKHTVRTFGEAMDSGDKGTNKAMSAAYKYAAFQTFCIPTEGDNDSENQTHEVASSTHHQIANTKPNNQQKPPEKDRKAIDQWLAWVDKFTGATLDMFIAQWEQYGAGAAERMSDDHRNELLIAKREMETFLMEKQEKKA